MRQSRSNGFMHFTRTLTFLMDRVFFSKRYSIARLCSLSYCGVNHAQQKLESYGDAITLSVITSR